MHSISWEHDLARLFQLAICRPGFLLALCGAERSETVVQASSTLTFPHFGSTLRS